MPFKAGEITLTADEQAELEQMAQSRTLPAGDVFRARLVLMLAARLPYRTIQQRLDTTAPTISRWRRRFQKQRIAGLLEIRHPGPTLLLQFLHGCIPADGSAAPLTVRSGRDCRLFYAPRSNSVSRVDSRSRPPRPPLDTASSPDRRRPGRCESGWDPPSPRDGHSSLGNEMKSTGWKGIRLICDKR